jgi:hypothetical protein
MGVRRIRAITSFEFYALIFMCIRELIQDGTRDLCEIVGFPTHNNPKAYFVVNLNFSRAEFPDSQESLEEEGRRLHPHEKLKPEKGSYDRE